MPKVFTDRGGNLRIVGTQKRIVDHTFKELKRLFPTVKGRTKAGFISNIVKEASEGISKSKRAAVIKAVLLIILIAFVAAITVSYILK